MKYRLVELLRCPSHPDELLRVMGAQVSEVFPYSGEVYPPVCRAGCGLLGNWFDDIPEQLPATHRFDCRRCLGVEIEAARIVCPQCGRALVVSNGVLQPAEVASTENVAQAGTVSPRTAGLIDRLLGLKVGELALVLAPLPPSTLERWGSSGVERLQVELDAETVYAARARSCANGQGLAHHLAGPVDAEALRPGQYDAIVSPVPPDRFSRFAEALGLLPSLLRPSGRALLMFPRLRGERGSGAVRLDRHRESLPESFQGFDARLAVGSHVDMLLMNRPGPSGSTVKAPMDPSQAE